jgi:hypothetical protein
MSNSCKVMTALIIIMSPFQIVVMEFSFAISCYSMYYYYCLNTYVTLLFTLVLSL